MNKNKYADRRIVSLQDMAGDLVDTENGIGSVIEDWLCVEDIVLSGLTVTQTTPASLGVSVAAGLAYQASGVGGNARISVPDAETLAIGTAHPTETRIDLIVVAYATADGTPLQEWFLDQNGQRVLQTTNTRTTDSYDLQVIAGTPGGGAPAVPTGYFALASVSVAAEATTIATADVTDLRPMRGTIPAREIDDLSASAADMRLDVDPGETGTESLPVDMAGEILRIRRILREITGKTYWYESPGGGGVPGTAHKDTHKAAGSDAFQVGDLTQAQTHGSPDTDAGTSSLHHTLGTGANQAAAGDHTHGAITNSELLFFPQVNTAGRVVGATGSAEGGTGGTVTVPAGVEVFVAGCTFITEEWTSTSLPTSSTRYLRATVVGGVLTWAVNATSTDSSQTDMLAAKITSGSSGTVPTVLNLKNAISLMASGVTTHARYTGVHWDTYTLNWARTPTQGDVQICVLDTDVSNLTDAEFGIDTQSIGRETFQINSNVWCPGNAAWYAAIELSWKVSI